MDGDTLILCYCAELLPYTNQNTSKVELMQLKKQMPQLGFLPGALHPNQQLLWVHFSNSLDLYSLNTKVMHETSESIVVNQFTPPSQGALLDSIVERLPRYCISSFASLLDMQT